MGELEVVPALPVLCRQQPPGAPLLDGVKPVARHALGHVLQQRVGVHEEERRRVLTVSGVEALSNVRVEG